MKQIYDVKNIKTFRGHEGEPLIQCSVYKHGKRIGFYSSGDWGGPPRLEMSQKEAVEMEEFAKRFLRESYVETYSIMLEKLAEDKLFTQKLKRHAKTKTVFRKKGQSKSEVALLQVAYTEDNIPFIHKYLEGKFGAGNYEILNDTL